MRADRYARVDRVRDFVTPQGCRVQSCVFRTHSGRMHEIVVLSTARRRNGRQ